MDGEFINTNRIKDHMMSWNDVWNDKYFVLSCIFLGLSIIMGGIIVLPFDIGMPDSSIIDIFIGGIISAVIIGYVSKDGNVVSLPIDISDKEIEGEKVRDLKSGELNPGFAGKIVAKSLIENNGCVLIDKYLCIGKEADKKFIPSECLKEILKSDKITIKRKTDTSTKFDDIKGIVEHNTVHYCIMDGGTLFHYHDKGERSVWNWTVSCLKKKELEKNFEKEFNDKEAKSISSEIIKNELKENIDQKNSKPNFLVLSNNKRYRCSTIEEMQKFYDALNFN